MIDPVGREVTYLRFSLTDRCNLKCRYCTLPSDPKESLTAQDVETILTAAAGLGFKKVRFTGGEPTLRKDLPEIIERCVAIPGIEEICLTTNGLLLDKLAQPLRDVGLTHLNLSCDTLDADRFKDITAGGSFDKWARGFEACIEAGFPSVKVNAVLMGGFNEDEGPAFANFAKRHGVEVRFIEYMPTESARKDWWRVPVDEFERDLVANFSLQERKASRHGGPARIYSFPEGEGRLGFIQAMSNPFCERCNRLRITSEGKIRSCLLTGGEVDLLSSIRAGCTVEQLQTLIRLAAAQKPVVYELHAEQDLDMRSVGG